MSNCKTIINKIKTDLVKDYREEVGNASAVKLSEITSVAMLKSALKDVKSVGVGGLIAIVDSMKDSKPAEVIKALREELEREVTGYTGRMLFGIKDGIIRATWQTGQNPSTWEEFTVLEAIPKDKVVQFELRNAKGATYTYSYPLGHGSGEELNNGPRLHMQDLVNLYSNYALTRYETIAEGKKEVSDRIDALENYTKLPEISPAERLAAIRDMLKSTPSDEVILDASKFAKVEDFTANKEGMLKTLEGLRQGNKFTVSDEMFEAYKDIISSLDESFFNNLELYAAAGKTQQGWYEANEKGDKIFLSHSSKMKDVYQTREEVFMHETVHAITYWALRKNDSDAVELKRQLRYAQLQAQKHTKVDDLLAVPKEQATEKDYDKAKKLYDYIFGSKNSLDEFTAYALTNPQLVKHLQKVKVNEATAETLYDKVMKVFMVIADVILGNYDFSSKDKNVQDQVKVLALKLGQINGRARDEAIKVNPIVIVSNVVRDTLDFVDDKTGKAVSYLWNKFDDGKPKQIDEFPENGSALQKGAWGLKFLARGVTNENYRSAIGLWMSMLWNGFKPEGDLRQFANDLFPEDEGKALATWLTLRAEKVDATRNTTAYQVIKDIKEGFSKPLTDEEEEALTAVLIDTDAGHLVYSKEGNKGKDNARLRELLTDKEKLFRAKQNSKKRIEELLGKEEARANIVKDLSMLLGIYMATGKMTEATITNAAAIAMGHGTPSRYKFDKDLVGAVKELSTLWALENVSEKDKNIVADLLLNERDGVYNIIDTYDGFKHASREELFNGDMVHMIEGYSKEIFEPTISMKVARLADKARLQKEGFELVGAVKTQAGAQKEAMGYYVSKAHAKAERMRGATNLGGLNAKGTSITEMNYIANPVMGKQYAERDIALANNRAAKMINQMAKREFDLNSVQWGLGRTTDAQGKVVDYRAVMSKDMKKKLLEQDTRISEVMGWTVASIQSKVMREVQNKEVLEAIKLMMQDWEGGEISGKNGLEEFDLIGPNATDPEMKELYYMLPKEFQQFIQNRADKTMAVRRGLRPILFGYTHAKISNAVGINKLSTEIKSVIDYVESLLFDLISIAKENLLIKLPQILYVNIVSNFLQILSMGVGFTDAVKLHRDSVRDVKEYMASSKEKLKLELEIKKLKSKYYRVENRGSVVNTINNLRKKIRDKEAEKSYLTEGNPRINTLEMEIEGLKDMLNKESVYSEVNGDRTQKEIFVMETRVKTLNKIIENSPVHELVTHGLMQSLVEDVDAAAMGDNNKITKFADRIMTNMPKSVQVAGDILFITKNTAYYKFMQQTFQLSDLVARDVVNRAIKARDKEIEEGVRDYDQSTIDDMKTLGVELISGKKLTDKEKAVYDKYNTHKRLQFIKNRFINYSQPNGKYEEWLNKSGILMFTKYFKRIQREIIANSKEHPVRAILGAATAIAGLDTMQGQSLLIKGEGFDGNFSIGNLLWVHNPIDNLMLVAEPPLIQLGGKLLN